MFAIQFKSICVTSFGKGNSLVALQMCEKVSLFFPRFFEVGLRGGLLCVLLLSEGGCLMRGSEGGDNEIWCGIASVGAGD